MAFLDIPGKDRRIRYVIETGSHSRWQKFRPVGRQAAYHKPLKMKFTENLQRRTRNVIITLTIICLTPLCEKGRKLSGAHSVNAFAGEELICAIDLGNEMYSSHGLETGLSYRLLGEFAKDNHCNVKVVAASSKENYIDSLRQGKVDILITNDLEETTLTDSIHILSEINSRSVWAVNNSDQNRIRQLNSWIGHMKGSDEYENLHTIYSGTINPHKRAEKGIITSRISPYDDLIKKYAKTLGWDWRMIAAVVYQESKFAIGSTSSRGARGLMQVMPQTGARYGVDNLLDPEQNIHAGTSHLLRLQKMFSKHDLSQDELIKFTLAAYNAGEGRIMDCRNFAAAKGADNTKWDEIVKVIPLMREDSILEEESVKLGKFQGYETIAYIENVMSHYKAICLICPTSL